MDKKKDQKQDEYDFYREVMKKKPLDKRKIAGSVAGLAAGAVLFGVIVAFVFAKTEPYFRKEEEPPRVSITDESGDTEEKTENEKEQNETVSGEEASEDQTDENGTDTADAADKEQQPLTLQEYSDLYQQISEAASEPSRSIVVVQGFTNDVDWMNNSFEDEKQASGFLVADTGKEYYVLTEYRVVDTVDRILVTFCDGSTVDGHFLKQDSATGLAVIKISRNDLAKETKDAIAVGELGSTSSVSQGDLVMALGSPSGYPDSVVCGRITSTTNLKSTVDREYHLLTTDIMGNSDGSGVLVNLQGKIVGLIAQSFSGESDTSVVTALSITDLRKLIEQLSNNEDVVYLGVRGQDIGSSLSQKTGIPTGIYVNSVEEDSPAMEAGIQNGDVIVKVGNESVETLTRLRSRLDQSKKDQKIKVTAMRKGAEGYVEIVFDVTLDAL